MTDERKRDRQEAEQLFAAFDTEFTLCNTARFEGCALPDVHYRYVPLTGNDKEEIEKTLETATAARRRRIDVEILSKRLRAWDVKKPVRDEDGEISGAEGIDCRDAQAIGTQVSYLVIRAVASGILDNASTEDAEDALADFTKPSNS